MSGIQIDQLFQQYNENIELKRQLSDALRNTKNREEWMQALEHRAKKQKEMYRQNNQIILDAAEYLLHLSETGDEKVADAFYRGLTVMCTHPTHDYSMIIQAIEPLLSFYVQKDDVNRIIFLYYLRYYELQEMLSRGLNPENPQSLWSDQEAILKFRDLYSTRLDAKSRTYIFAVYFNLIVVGYDTKYLSIDRSYEYLIEMMDFWQSEEVQNLDKTNVQIQMLIERTQIEWLSNFENAPEIPPQMLQYYLALSDELCQKELQKSDVPATFHYELLVTHLHTEVLRGDLSWDQAFLQFFDYYDSHCTYLRSNEWNQKKKELSSLSNDYMNYLLFYVNAPSLMHKWISFHSLSQEIYQTRIPRFLEEIDFMWDTLYQTLPSPYLDEKIFEWSFQLLPYIGNSIVQEKWVTRAIMKRHITTYIHSVMVEKLCEQVASHILKKQPSLFESLEGLYGLSLQHPQYILHFVKKAALYHDIGKNRIAEAIDTQTRRLTDNEISMIRLHPQYGHRLIKDLTILEPFQDIILGHHKFYNGKGGYPISFDNTQSPVKIIIDLVSICDTLDAMTDPIGRNYNTTKKLSDFLKAMDQEKGVRYNPDLINFIENDASLIQELAYLTSEGRFELIYQIYDDIQ